ncbi:hypothetical protein BG97_3194 [Burkholderia pseudomallei 7894]|nr:hypothetical protein BG97_3194 [Burkholderia pseudomallei 7894]
MLEAKSLKIMPIGDLDVYYCQRMRGYIYPQSRPSSRRRPSSILIHKLPKTYSDQTQYTKMPSQPGISAHRNR